MADPKPISLTYTDPVDYAGPDPQPFTVVGAEPGDSAFDLTAVPGFDAGEDQTLKVVAGIPTWVTDAP